MPKPFSYQQLIDLIQGKKSRRKPESLIKNLAQECLFYQQQAERLRRPRLVKPSAEAKAVEWRVDVPYDEDLARSREAEEVVFEKSDAATEANPRGFLITFPVADGLAYYRVVDIDPILLEHIPISDGYQVSIETFRGISMNTIYRQMANRDGPYCGWLSKKKRQEWERNNR